MLEVFVKNFNNNNNKINYLVNVFIKLIVYIDL